MQLNKKNTSLMLTRIVRNVLVFVPYLKKFSKFQI